jgi:tetratricopeptide (TPR) repeat protein
MTDLGRWLPTAFSVLTAVALVQNVAVAKSAPEINQIAQAITVRIAVGQGNGSGILLQKDRDVYTVLTAAHVVKGESAGKLTITTADDKQYKAIEVRRYQGDVDLAIVRFRSAGSYQLAELGDSNRLAGGMDLYAGGFPAPTRVITEPVFVFRRGQVVANSKQVFKDGYALLYDNRTLPGMSGGPILDEVGKVVAIHGKGDRDQDTDAPTGYSAGIPISRFADIARRLGVDVDKTVASTIRNPSFIADGYFVSAFGKKYKQDYQGALADFNQSISLKPDFAGAYSGRGDLKYENLNDYKGALADYNKSIALRPDQEHFYFKRGNLKFEKLNDLQGALVDFNQSISLQPDYVEAYNSRGNLKFERLNDLQGALLDFNKSISLRPDHASFYRNRGNLKFEGLNDAKGALADYNQSISLKPDYAEAYSSRGALKTVKLNDVKGALADYNQSISLKPDFALAYNNRGILKYKNLNDVKGAITDFKKSEQLYRQQGNVQKADQIKVYSHLASHLARVEKLILLRGKI